MSIEDLGVAEAREVLGGLKLFWCLDDSEIEVTRLGGRTNTVFRADHAGEQYVLRLPGKGTEHYIDRNNEFQAAREAARVGVSPDVLYFDLETGVMVTRLVDDAVTMSKKRFRSIAGSPARAARAFRKLHGSGAIFASHFEVFSMIDKYLDLLAARRVKPPPGFRGILRRIHAVRAALKAQPLPEVPCHCDPLCENLLDTGNRMWLVDWEYSGMGDPMWDLACLSVDCGFGAVQEKDMIGAYFEGESTPAERGRIVLYKALADLLWILRGLIQPAGNGAGGDTAKRLERSKMVMAAPEFMRHVAAVRG